MPTTPIRRNLEPRASRRANLFLLMAYLVLFIPAPTRGERLWLDLYRMRPTDMESTPQPPPVLLGCRFSGCFPGFSTQQTLTLETAAKGPFLKRWVLGLESLPAEERNTLTLGGDAKNLSPTAIQLGRVATVDSLRPEHGDQLPHMPVTIELDLDALRSWAAGGGPPLTDVPELVLEARQLVGSVEVHRWRFVYDFSALAPAAAGTPPATGRDQIVLQHYSPTSSPVVLVARGNDLAQRMTDVFRVPSTFEVDNMTAETPNVEVAVWSYDNQPVLDLKPKLSAGTDLIPESASGLLQPTPNLRLPGGNPASGIEWKNLARCDYAVANHLFLRNRMGLELQFTVGGTSTAKLCDESAVLKQKIELRKDNLNISYVAEDDEPQNCCLEGDPETMFITARATPTTLAHELGHSFGLMHVESSHNIMLGGALERSEFTLPQVYLMMFGAESTLNLLGLRGPPTRTKNDCPAHCRPGVSTLFIPQCVDLNAAFSAPGSPPPTGEIQALLTALSSEESVPTAVLSSASLLPGLLPFLANVVQKGAQLDPINETINGIRALLNDSDCPIAADAYIEFYRSRVLANSQRTAADLIFALHTQQAKQVLENLQLSTPENLKSHIKDLLSHW